MDPLRTRFAAGVLCRLIEDGCKTSVLCFLNLTVSLDLHAKIGLQHLFRAYSLKSGLLERRLKLGCLESHRGGKWAAEKKTGGLALCVGGIRQLNSSRRPAESLIFLPQCNQNAVIPGTDSKIFYAFPDLFLHRPLSSNVRCVPFQW